MTRTTLSRWDPFRDFVTIQGRVNHLFGDSLASSPDADGFTGWAPPVDIVEEGERLVLRAEIPGVQGNDIDINVESGTITLRGEKKQEKGIEAKNAFRAERFYGTFFRSFVLPKTINPEAIAASYKDGVLEVVLPKAKEARARRIEIS